MKSNKTAKNYEAPQLEILEVTIEKGFAVTGDNTEGFGGWQ